MTRDEWENAVSTARAAIFWFEDALAGKKQLMADFNYSLEDCVIAYLEALDDLDCWKRSLAQLEQMN